MLDHRQIELWNRISDTNATLNECTGFDGGLNEDHKCDPLYQCFAHKHCVMND